MTVIPWEELLEQPTGTIFSPEVDGAFTRLFVLGRVVKNRPQVAELTPHNRRGSGKHNKLVVDRGVTRDLREAIRDGNRRPLPERVAVYEESELETVLRHVEDALG